MRQRSRPDLDLPYLKLFTIGVVGTPTFRHQLPFSNGNGLELARCRRLGETDWPVEIGALSQPGFTDALPTAKHQAKSVNLIGVRVPLGGGNDNMFEPLLQLATTP